MCKEMSSYSCSNKECNYVTKNKSHMKIHLKSIKCYGSLSVETKGTIKCDICSKEFETELYLNSHKKICIEKRTNTVVSYASSVEINNEIRELKNLIKSMFGEIEYLKEEVILLKSKFDLMEKNPMSKKEVENFEDLGEEEDDVKHLL